MEAIYAQIFEIWIPFMERRSNADILMVLALKAGACFYCLPMHTPVISFMKRCSKRGKVCVSPYFRQTFGKIPSNAKQTNIIVEEEGMSSFFCLGVRKLLSGVPPDLLYTKEKDIMWRPSHYRTDTSGE